jgi:hypothetical protein
MNVGITADSFVGSDDIGARAEYACAEGDAIYSADVDEDRMTELFSENGAG